MVHPMRFSLRPMQYLSLFIRFQKIWLNEVFVFKIAPILIYLRYIEAFLLFENLKANYCIIWDGESKIW